MPRSKEERAAADKKRYEANKEQILERSRAWYRENKEAAKEARKVYYEAHKEEYAARGKIWRESEPERALEVRRDWVKRNPESVRAAQSRRRQRRVDACAVMDQEDKKISVEYRKAIANDPCYYCGGPANTEDHYHPIAAGGTDHWWNLVRACQSCNSRKKDKHGDTFVNETMVQ